MQEQRDFVFDNQRDAVTVTQRDARDIANADQRVDNRSGADQSVDTGTSRTSEPLLSARYQI